jgi:hypothetical protein
MDTRTCRLCREDKALDEFYEAPFHVFRECKVCLIKEESRRRRAEKLKAKYGMTLDDYDAMLEDQQGRCAICGLTPAEAGHKGKHEGILFIDHDHETGKVRKLLCRDCNFGLGFFHDSPERLEAAARYLRECADLTTAPEDV